MQNIMLAIMFLNFLMATENIKKKVVGSKHEPRKSFKHSDVDLKLYRNFMNESGVFIIPENHSKKELDMVFSLQIFKKEQEDLLNQNSHRNNYVLYHQLKENWTNNGAYWLTEFEKFNIYDFYGNMNYQIQKGYYGGDIGWIDAVQWNHEFDDKGNRISTQEQNSLSY